MSLLCCKFYQRFPFQAEQKPNSSHGLYKAHRDPGPAFLWDTTSSHFLPCSLQASHTGLLSASQILIHGFPYKMLAQGLVFLFLYNPQPSTGPGPWKDIQ